MRKPVHIHVERKFEHAREAAYAWLTDIDDADASRTGAVLETRKVIERAPGRLVYEGETSVLGNRIFGRTEVSLHPPDRWEARTVSGPREGSFTHYHLVSEGKGCRISVDYHFLVTPVSRHRLLRIAKPLVRRELVKMWEGFGQAMDKELPREASSSTAPAQPQAR